MSEYRCPYCGSPLIDADIVKDRETLFCADCGGYVEFFDALEAGDTSEEKRRDDVT